MTARRPRLSPASRILYVIPARGNSKGVPRKNLAEIDGLSLVARRVISARRSSRCSRLIVSTDDQEIVAEATRFGAEVPFLRPSELASDDASVDAVVRHAMDWVRDTEGLRYDAVLIAQPTSPFATSDDYDAAIAVMQERNVSVVVGVAEARHPSLWQGPLDRHGLFSVVARRLSARRDLRRQGGPPEYTLNGAVFLVRWDVLEERGTRHGDPSHTAVLSMPLERSLEIDDDIDLDFARFMVASGRIDRSPWQPPSQS